MTLFNNMPRTSAHDAFRIGCTDFFDRVDKLVASNKSSFPFHNVKKIADGKWKIEMALAGYVISDLDVTLDKNVLTVSSDGHKQDDNVEFLFRGFASRAFARQFVLADKVEVTGADMSDGILSVWLDSIATEDKPKKINISQPSAKSAPGLLNEDSSI